MPKQETFFEQTVGGRHIEVVKSYDQAYAREASGAWTAMHYNASGPR